MQSSSLRRRLPQVIFVFAALVVGVFLAHADTINVIAGTFAYTNQVQLCNRFPAGSVTSATNGATTGTLTDTASGNVPGGWQTNEYAAHTVHIIAGTGAGATNNRTISSNTGTQLTVSPPWTPTPDATSRYYIEINPTDANCSDGSGAIG